MNFPIASSDGDFLPEEKKSKVLDSRPDTSSENNQDNTGLTLAYNIRHPLTNIILAIDMLETEIKDVDFIVFVDIIKRGSMRINNLLNEYIKKNED